MPGLGPEPAQARVLEPGLALEPGQVLALGLEPELVPALVLRKQQLTH